jgi:hypothetical protein
MSDWIRVVAPCLLFLITFFPAVNVLAQGEEIGVVKIRNEKLRRVGTGVIVKTYKPFVYIVTAAHVVEGEKTPQITFPGLGSYKGETLTLEGGDDRGLALIVVEEELSHKVRALALEPYTSAVQGDSVSVIGFPRVLNTPWARIPAKVAGRSGKEITVSASIEEGNSGSPVIKNGKVIGIIVQADDRMGYATPTSVVLETLKGWGVKIAPSDEDFCFIVNQLTGLARNNFKDLRKGAGTPDSFGKQWKVPSDLDLSGMGRSLIRSVENEHEFYVAWMDYQETQENAIDFWQSLVTRVKACKPDWTLKHEQRNEARFEEGFKVFRGKIVIEVGLKGEGPYLPYIGVGNWFKGPYGR